MPSPEATAEKLRARGYVIIEPPWRVRDVANAGVPLRFAKVDAIHVPFAPEWAAHAPADTPVPMLRRGMRDPQVRAALLAAGRAAPADASTGIEALDNMPPGGFQPGKLVMPVGAKTKTYDVKIQFDDVLDEVLLSNTPDAIAEHVAGVVKRSMGAPPKHRP